MRLICNITQLKCIAYLKLCNLYARDSYISFSFFHSLAVAVPVDATTHIFVITILQFRS